MLLVDTVVGCDFDFDFDLEEEDETYTADVSCG